MRVVTETTWGGEMRCSIWMDFHPSTQVGAPREEAEKVHTKMIYHNRWRPTQNSVTQRRGKGEAYVRGAVILDAFYSFLRS